VAAAELVDVVLVELDVLELVEVVLVELDVLEVEVVQTGAEAV
jgi:hypothetical protein